MAIEPPPLFGIVGERVEGTFGGFDRGGSLFEKAASNVDQPVGHLLHQFRFLDRSEAEVGQALADDGSEVDGLRIAGVRPVAAGPGGVGRVRHIRGRMRSPPPP
jgi:hypothetical protein